METTNSRGPIIVRLFEAMNDYGVEQDNSERRRLIKEITGVSKQNLLHWFNGTTTTPGIDHIVKLSEYFNIDLNWLITGEAMNATGDTSKFVGHDTAVNRSAKPQHNLEHSLDTIIDRLCEGIRQSGITDVKASLLKTANDVYGVAHQTVHKWLDKESEPTIVEAASLCEFYGVAQRYVSLGVGPILALDYITAAAEKSSSVLNRHEVIRLKDVALLGNV
ncbi:MAG: helix-turn-helix transcriptional regulator [Nitrosomonadaceae bacterium]